ncbi:MAG: hypothetical protein AB7I27_00590 [Bacteriovoracaceae bacterium]
MQIEREYTCWHLGQSEADGKDVKAPTVREAAKMAVDIWRHESLKDLEGRKVTVFVRDVNDDVHQVIVTNEGDFNAPEASF